MLRRARPPSGSGFRDPRCHGVSEKGQSGVRRLESGLIRRLQSLRFGVFSKFCQIYSTFWRPIVVWVKKRGPFGSLRRATGCLEEQTRRSRKPDVRFKLLNSTQTPIGRHGKAVFRQNPPFGILASSTEHPLGTSSPRKLATRCSADDALCGSASYGRYATRAMGLSHTATSLSEIGAGSVFSSS